MTWPALLALLWAIAVLASYRARGRPSLRRAAVALVLLAVADSVRLALASPQSGEIVRLDVALSLLWPTAAAWLIGGTWPLAVGMAYAVGLAAWGRRLAPWWGWALRAPRVAVALLATAATWRELRTSPEPRWTASQRVGLLLAAGQFAAVATNLWADWGDVRWISAGVYVAIGGVILFERRSR